MEGVANDSATTNDEKKLRPLVALVKSNATPGPVAHGVAVHGRLTQPFKCRRNWVALIAIRLPRGEWFFDDAVNSDPREASVPCTKGKTPTVGPSQSRGFT
jgi:hypothetical protein